jgi:hypothetical protein
MREYGLRAFPRLACQVEHNFSLNTSPYLFAGSKAKLNKDLETALHAATEIEFCRAQNVSQNRENKSFKIQQTESSRSFRLHVVVADSGAELVAPEFMLAVVGNHRGCCATVNFCFGSSLMARSSGDEPVLSGFTTQNSGVWMPGLWGRPSVLRQTARQDLGGHRIENAPQIRISGVSI